MKKIALKITPRELELLESRAVLFNYSFIAVYSNTIRWKFITNTYDVMIIADEKNNCFNCIMMMNNNCDIYSILQHFELIKNKKLELVMKELTGIDVDEAYSLLGDEVFSKDLDEDMEKCFKKDNVSARIRVRRAMNKISEFASYIKQ